MNFRTRVAYVCALGLSALALQAQPSNQTQQLSQQIQQLQDTFQRQQRELRESFERMLREQQAQIEALKQQVTALSGVVTPSIVAPAIAGPAPATTATTGGTGGTGGTATPATATVTTASAEDVQELKERVDQLTTASKRTSVNQFNPGIGFVVDTLFGYTGKGQGATGSDRPGGFDATLRTAELNLEASVDPFAKAYGVLAGSADARTGEANLSIEEAAIVTTSLPWHLTVQGGRFFGEFGRLSYIHDHDLPFVFRPLVLDRYIGGESRTDGLQVNYLFPTEHFVSLTLGVGNGFGAEAGPTPPTGYRNLGGVNSWGRLSTYFDLTPNLNLETGVSGLADANAEGAFGDPTQRDRYIGAADITLRYQPLGSTIREGYVWGTEVLVNSARFETGPDAFNRQNAVGLYSYVEKRLNRQFKAGFLFDWLQEPSNAHADTMRFSPYLTWNPSEFQLFRLQYSRTEPNGASGLANSDAIYLQWDAILGRHVHGFKQR